MSYGKYFGKNVPRGIRNNNPGNVELGSPWQGLVPKDKQTDKRFCQCVDAASGIRIIAVTLTTYFDKRKARDGSKIDSIKEVIERWAPSNENDVDSYAMQIQSVLGVNANSETLDLHDYETMRKLVEGIIRHENGAGPLNNINTWYTGEEIGEGLRRAGIVSKQSSPVNKTTVAATGVAITGMGQLVEVLEPVKIALNSVHGDISSGDLTRISFAIVAIGLSAWIAYVQYKKHKIGVSL